jgi:tetratricopeptide (TPR) repeat protein
MATISEALAIAIQHHQAGQLQLAEQIYRQILAVEPNHVDALHLLGVLACQAGRHQAGIEYIARAIGLNGGQAAFHSNLGEAYRAVRRIPEAVACYRRALELNPDYAGVHNNLGIALKDQGKTNEAVACFRRALELAPDYAEAHNNLGNLLAKQGKLDEAISCYRRALELKPDSPDRHNHLGSLLRTKGRLDEAIASYRRALELKPDFAEACNNLGNALEAEGKPDEAITWYRQALQRKPDFAEAHNNLGNALQGQGAFDEAVVCYRQALERKPDYAEAYNNLGIALKDQGKPDEAILCYRQAVQRKPDFAEAHNNLGNALKEQGKLDEAVACFRRALELKPNFAGAYYNLGIALQDQGKLDEAIACYRQALQLKPDYAQAHVNLGIAFTSQGNLDEAAACYRQVVRLGRSGEVQHGLGDAFFQLAAILQSRFPEDDLLLIRQWLARPDLGDDDRAALQFALAQVLDARGDYSEAASHLVEANAARLAALKEQERDYVPADYHSFVSDVLATLTPQFFARAGGFGLETELPVFVVGLPRSGTTLVEQILASHSLVFGAGELDYCRDTCQSLPKAVHRDDAPLTCLLDLDRETCRLLAQRHLDRLRALDPRALRIVDKMPENCQYLGLIRVLFPRARLIHCRRDLRDVALSCWMTNFTSVPWACDREQMISYFEEYSRLMDHWRNVLPAPPLEVDYEELVKDAESVARRIVAWCELEWEPQCLRFYQTQRPVRTASAAQVRRPIYTSSVGRWKNYESALGDLFSRVRGR